MGNRSEPFLEGIGALLDLAGEARGLKDHIDVNLKYGPFVAGIEVTQSIQYYQASEHLTADAMAELRRALFFARLIR